MADLFGEVAVWLFQVAWEGTFAATHTRAGWAMSAAALLSLLGAIGLFVAAGFQADSARQANLAGLGCCLGGWFILMGITTLFVKAGDS